MAKTGWKSKSPSTPVTPVGPDTKRDEQVSEEFDLEEMARGKITRHITAIFKGHGMAVEIIEIRKMSLIKQKRK